MREEARRFRAWGALALAGAALVGLGAGQRSVADGESRLPEGQALTQIAFDVVINEVESRGGSAGDWVELYNASSAAIDLSGFRFKDGDDSHTYYVLPAGTVLAAGSFLVLDQAQFGFGLGGADSVRLYAPQGDIPVASYSWTAHAAVTQGRCRDGSGAFAATRSATKGEPNDCSTLAMTAVGSASAGERDVGSQPTAALLPGAPQR